MAKRILPKSASTVKKNKSVSPPTGKQVIKGKATATDKKTSVKARSVARPVPGKSNLVKGGSTGSRNAGASSGARAAAKTINSNAGSSKKQSAYKDPFAEKLNRVTPSGYQDQTFFEQVFDVARQIPKGRVTSYGAIAASLGARSSSRMVGWAMNLAGSAKPKVPAHRVVNRNGMLSGKHHFATPTHMQELLEKEGVKVKNDKVVDFNKLFWDPMDLGD